MTFADRLKEKRIERGLSQQALADAAGISLRSVQNYESGKRYPSNIGVAVKLASLLDTTSQYLLGEESNYIFDAEERGGVEAKREMRRLVEQVSGMFAGGTLEEDDRDAAMQALSEAYWIAKKESKKYTRKQSD